MSDEDARFRRVKRGKRTSLPRADMRRAEEIVERMKQSGKVRDRTTTSVVPLMADLLERLVGKKGGGPGSR